MTLFNLKNNRFAPKPKSKGFLTGYDNWTKELSPEQLTEIKSDITSGRGTKFIVLKMNDWGLWLDIKIPTAKKRISRFYRNVIREEAAANGLWLPTNRLTRGVDVQFELETLIAAQKRRLKKLREREKKTPLLIDQVSKESEVLAQLLSRLARLQQDTITNKSDRVRKGTMTVDPKNPNTVHFQSTESLVSRLAEMDKEFE